MLLRGIKLPAARYLLHTTGNTDYEKKAADNKNEEDPSPAAKPQNDQPSSSIFDSFDTAPQQKPTKENPQSGGMASSIFDNFDAAPPKPKPQKSTGGMASSIFDSFDAAM